MERTARDRSFAPDKLLGGEGLKVVAGQSVNRDQMGNWLLLDFIVEENTGGQNG